MVLLALFSNNLCAQHDGNYRLSMLVRGDKNAKEYFGFDRPRDGVRSVWTSVASGSVNMSIFNDTDTLSVTLAGSSLNEMIDFLANYEKWVYTKEIDAIVLAYPSIHHLLTIIDRETETYNTISVVLTDRSTIHGQVLLVNEAGVLLDTAHTLTHNPLQFRIDDYVWVNTHDISFIGRYSDVADPLELIRIKSRSQALIASFERYLRGTVVYPNSTPPELASLVVKSDTLDSSDITLTDSEFLYIQPAKS